MREENKIRRHQAISAAAYSLVAEKGYDATSMLSVAKAAKASNETLYRWYGDKRGLFEAMVRDNAAEIKKTLEQSLTGDEPTLLTLERVSNVFLSMLLGDRAILLNRAAAAEASGELGAAISAGGREVVQPLFEALVAKLIESETEARALTGLFLGLLVGDLQIKRMIGNRPALSKAEINTQVTVAITAFKKLLA